MTHKNYRSGKQILQLNVNQLINIDLCNGLFALAGKFQESFDDMTGTLGLAVNGAEVHAWIQQNRPELCTRIILISGDTANSDTQQLLKQSGTPCIEKPFRVQQLLTVVEKTFGRP